jgi:hypothetical protein
MSERKVEAFEHISGAPTGVDATLAPTPLVSMARRRQLVAPKWHRRRKVWRERNIGAIRGYTSPGCHTSAWVKRARKSLCTHSDQNRGGNSGREAYKELAGTPHKWLNRARNLVLPEKLVETVGIATLPTNFSSRGRPARTDSRRRRPSTPVGNPPRAGVYVWRWDCQSWGTFPEGPGTGWSTGWCSGGARAGPSSKNSSVGNE